MEVSINDLKHNTRDFIAALQRGEGVTITYYRRRIGIALPYDRPRDPSNRRYHDSLFATFSPKYAFANGPARRLNRLVRCAAPDSFYLVATEVISGYQCGYEPAFDALDAADRVALTGYSYMELLCHRPKVRYQRLFCSFLRNFDVEILAVTERICHRAMTFIESYGMPEIAVLGLSVDEALLAATALEHDYSVLTREPGRLAQIPNLKVAELSDVGVTPVRILPRFDTHELAFR